MTGFPGETAEDFETLRRFVEETEFERLGVFAYSREAGTLRRNCRGRLPRICRNAVAISF